MIGPLLLSLLALMPVVSPFLSSSQDSQLMNLLATSRGAAEGYPEWILQSSKTVKSNQSCSHRKANVSSTIAGSDPHHSPQKNTVPSRAARKTPSSPTTTKHQRP
ncbi:hypothetical protein Q1695_007740 [Nippostrongylus brasiliensis]|nr:hypothetical protein Q1695_007740 [Nippostrongylus brasiliensis]